MTTTFLGMGDGSGNLLLSIVLILDPPSGLRRVDTIREPRETLLARPFHADGVPDLALGAGCLDEARGLAEAREGEGEVLADEGVGVVLAHLAGREGGGFASWGFRGCGTKVSDVGVREGSSESASDVG